MHLMCKGWVLASASPGNLWPFFFKYHVMSCSGPETRCVRRRRAPTEHVTLNQMHNGRAPSVIYTFLVSVQIERWNEQQESSWACLILAASNRQTSKKKKGKNEAGKANRRTDGRADMSCWPILLLPAEKERERRWEQENLCRGDRCLSFSTPSPPSLQHLRQ